MRSGAGRANQPGGARLLAPHRDRGCSGRCGCHRSSESTQILPLQGAGRHARAVPGLLGCFEVQEGVWGGSRGSQAALSRRSGTWPFARPGGTGDPGGGWRGQWGAVGCPWAAPRPRGTESKMSDGGGQRFPATPRRGNSSRVGRSCSEAAKRGGSGEASWLRLTGACLFSQQSVIFPALYLFAAT